MPRVRGALVVAAALVLTGCSDDGGAATGQGFVSRDGIINRVAPDERRPAPEISGTALGSDKTLSTADYAGQVIVLNVWGSWCGPCREEAPALVAASARTKDTAQFLGITIRDPSPAQAEAFVRANKITYPSIYDPDGTALLPLAGDLPPSVIPTTLIIDEQGRIAVRVLNTITETTLVDLIDDVANGV